MGKPKQKSVFNAHWIVSVGIVSNHIILIGVWLYYTNVNFSFYLAAILAGFLQTLGITAGYHRLWSHHAYHANNTLKYALQMLGSASWQGSVRWWVLRHRMHHRFVDTKFDPYNANRGLWFSHFGWLFEAPVFYEKASTVDMTDLSNDPVVEFNRRYYPHQVILLGLLLPALLGYAMGDTLAGFLYIGVLSRCISWNGIFFVNSLAHYWGSREYNGIQTATQHFVTAFLSNGEGWHNYHHEFPHDYRHGVRWYQWDPTKWCIYVWSLLGAATKLVTADPHIVEECMLHTSIQQQTTKLKSLESDLASHLTAKKSGPVRQEPFAGLGVSLFVGWHL